MKNNCESPPSSPKDILNELHLLIGEAEKMASNTLSENTSEAVEALRSRFEAAHERLGELYADTRKKIVAGAKCTDEAIRTHPYQSIAIAAGVGLVIGILVGRRTK